MLEPGKLSSLRKDIRGTEPRCHAPWQTSTPAESTSPSMVALTNVENNYLSRPRSRSMHREYSPSDLIGSVEAERTHITFTYLPHPPSVFHWVIFQLCLSFLSCTSTLPHDDSEKSINSRMSHLASRRRRSRSRGKAPRASGICPSNASLSPSPRRQAR